MTTVPPAIVRTGAANLASVLAGLERAGIAADITDDPSSVREARLVVLPGVGAFGPAARALHSNGLADAIRDRARREQPVLAICLGLQLLARRSAESPGEPGLSIIDADITRFDTSARVPHLGWNRVKPDDRVGLTPGYAYYANSYKLDALPPGWDGAWSTYGKPFIAALRRGSLVACQFHPELSGPWGLELIRAWSRGREMEVTAC